MRTDLEVSISVHTVGRNTSTKMASKMKNKLHKRQRDSLLQDMGRWRARLGFRHYPVHKKNIFEGPKGHISAYAPL